MVCEAWEVTDEAEDESEGQRSANQETRDCHFQHERKKFVEFFKDSSMRIAVGIAVENALRTMILDVAFERSAQTLLNLVGAVTSGLCTSHLLQTPAWTPGQKTSEKGGSGVGELADA